MKHDLGPLLYYPHSYLIVIWCARGGEGRGRSEGWEGGDGKGSNGRGMGINPMMCWSLMVYGSVGGGGGGGGGSIFYVFLMKQPSIYNLKLPEIVSVNFHFLPRVQHIPTSKKICTSAFSLNDCTVNKDSTSQVDYTVYHGNIICL